MHQLAAKFSEQYPDFNDRLWSEASHLGLARPLRYALRYATRYFETAASTGVREGARPVIESVTDACVDRAVRSPLDLRTGVGVRLAQAVLYLRSHWLRMPPGLLLRHLGAKALRGRKNRSRPGMTARR